MYLNTVKYLGKYGYICLTIALPKRKPHPMDIDKVLGVLELPSQLALAAEMGLTKAAVTHWITRGMGDAAKHRLERFAWKTRGVRPERLGLDE